MVIQEVLLTMWQSFLDKLFPLSISIVWLIIGFVLGKIIGKVIKEILVRVKLDNFIIESERIKLKLSDMSDLYNDLIAKLHNVDMVAKQLTNQNNFMKKNIRALIQNLLFYIIVSGPKTIDQISQLAGIPKVEVEHFVQQMEKMGKVKKEGDLYKWHGNKKQD